LAIEYHIEKVGSSMRDVFYINNKMTVGLEELITRIDSFEEFEKRYSDEFLAEDRRVGNYLEEIMWKYQKDYATTSRYAGLAPSYVGNIIRGIKNNPGRDALIAICLTVGTTAEEIQYLLKYAGHAPLYVRRKRDVIIWFGFMKQLGIDRVDEMLYDRGYKTLRKPE